MYPNNINEETLIKLKTQEFNITAGQKDREIGIQGELVDIKRMDLAKDIAYGNRQLSLYEDRFKLADEATKAKYLQVKAKAVINNLKGALDANLYTTKQAIREQMLRSGKAGSALETQQLDRVDKLHKENVDMYANEKTAPYLVNIINMKEYEKYTFEQKR